MSQLPSQCQSRHSCANWLQKSGSGAIHLLHPHSEGHASADNCVRQVHHRPPEARIAAIINSVDRLGNLQLLIERENLEKSDLSFETWIETRDQSIVDTHLIPERPDLWRVAMLPEFVQAREALMREQLKMVVGV